MNLTELLRLYLRDHTQKVPGDSLKWDEFDEHYVHAIRGGFRRFIKSLNLDYQVESQIMEALTEDATE